MEKYTINKNFGVVRLPFSVMHGFDDSMKEERKGKIVGDSIASQISSIDDFEMTAFEPYFNSLTFDLFFYRKINRGQNMDIRTMLSTPYVNYFDQLSTYFSDKTEFPTFWNSFGYPFYDQKEKWYVPESDGTPSEILQPKRFDSQTYLYNSFIKMNFYTSPYSISQELLFQNIVYVNPRWCDVEGDLGGTWRRPTFQLNSMTDGFYLYWLNNYTIDTFYVSFQFWDSLNGRMINLYPSGVNSIDKQWVQGVNSFDSRNMYLEYKVNYTNKKYSISEFNLARNLWESPSNNIRLYELIFDEDLSLLNPYITVPNGTYSSSDEPIIGDGVFNITIDNNTVPIYYNFPFIYSRDILNFQSLRDAWVARVESVRNTYRRSVTISNTGNESIYLKNIQIEITQSNDSTSPDRLTGFNKQIAVSSIGQRSTNYTFYCIPNYDLSSGNGLQTGFADYYFPERNVPNDDNYGQTVAVRNVDENGSAPYESAAWMAPYYPINSTNMQTYGKLFAENLVISHYGDDQSGILPNETMQLNLQWFFGENYGYTNVEPIFYALCDDVNAMANRDYIVNFEYKVTLFFNDLHNSFPEFSNKLEFMVYPQFDFRYKRNGTDIGRE